MRETTQRRHNLSLTTLLVDKIADHKGVDSNGPEFCLYEDTDPEALEHFLEQTEGPVTTQFQLDDSRVIVKKTVEGEITINVESVMHQSQASD
ncbi:HalOD1 output domain-containing protein [Halorussus sp. AFM4]|uniref:HalOD1 output domain-containing protein n=1 Tax=Halorussus sp. AFM4 TaxID=3421651 RepID=UPI003EBAC1BA